MISSFGISRRAAGATPPVDTSNTGVDAALNACASSPTPYAAACAVAAKRDAVVNGTMAVISAMGLAAQGVKECWFYLPDVQTAARKTFLDIQDAVGKSWYTARKKAGLAAVRNPDELPAYETTVQTCQGGYCHGQNKTTFLGNQSRRMLEILAKDATWNSFQSEVWGSGKNARRLYIDGRIDPFHLGVDPDSSPYSTCDQRYINEWNSIAANLFQTYRIGPAKAAALQVMRETQTAIDKELAAKRAASSSSQAASSATKTWAEAATASKQSQQTVLIVGVLGLAIGGVFAVIKRKK